MALTDAYLGFGGNIGNSAAILRQAIIQLMEVEGVYDVVASRFYQTTPVSDIPQSAFVNAVCRCRTLLTAKELQQRLQQIERALGKTKKAKNVPRIIDIDMLFFGTECQETPELTLPHPRWQERLFVLVPLADVAEEIDVPNKKGTCRVNIKEYLQSFSNPHNEIVTPLE